VAWLARDRMNINFVNKGLVLVSGSVFENNNRRFTGLFPDFLEIYERNGGIR
jgi:hypothetical protein